MHLKLEILKKKHSSLVEDAEWVKVAAVEFATSWGESSWGESCEIQGAMTASLANRSAFRRSIFSRVAIA
jgi:hypothetical protein